MMKHMTLLLLSAVAAIPSCSKEGPSGGGPGQTKQAPRVTVGTIAPRDVRYAIDAVGTLEADEIRIHARVSGVVTKMTFQEGDAVTPETALAEIDPRRYSLDAARALAEKERAEIAHRKAQDDHRRFKKLFATGNATQDEVETAETQMMAARAAVDAAVALHALAQKSVDESFVRPPTAGVIQSKVAVLGEYMKPETLIATMIDLSSLRLRFTLSESEAAKATVGRKAGFTVSALPGIPFEGEIFYISQSAHPQTRMVECKARNIAAKNGIRLRPGMFVNVRIETEARANSMVVPTQAVIPTERGAVVYVLDGKTARMKTVDIGLHTPDGGVEILSGIGPTDRLVIRGANFLRDGMEVEAIEEKGDK